MKSSAIIKRPYLSFGWLLFILLAIAVSLETPQLFFIDRDTLNYFSRFITPPRTAFFRIITFSGSPIVTLFLSTGFSILLWHRKKIRESLTALTITVTGNAVGLLIKFLVQRPRPTTLLDPASGYGFPSGHVIGSMILVFLVITFGLKLISVVRLRISIVMLLILWLGLVALSRLYLQVHYPSDVFGGGLFALLWCETVLIASRQNQLKLDQLIRDNRGIHHED